MNRPPAQFVVVHNQHAQIPQVYGRRAGGSACGIEFSGRVNQKVEPSPGRLSTPIVASHELDQLFAKSPIPNRFRRKRRVVELSAWLNFLE